MYAVIKTGGKQYRVTKGQTLRVEKLENEVGTDFDLSEVLMVADGENIKVGAPTVDGSKVTATILSHGREKKVHILKFRRRKHHMKRQGHRQYYTEIEIKGISA